MHGAAACIAKMLQIYAFEEFFPVSFVITTIGIFSRKGFTGIYRLLVWGVKTCNCPGRNKGKTTCKLLPRKQYVG